MLVIHWCIRQAGGRYSGRWSNVLNPSHHFRFKGPNNPPDMNYRTHPVMAKVILTSALAPSLFHAQATVYHVSPTGNDANNGTTEATAWKTIDRVNQLAFSYQPGDQILFQRGGTYRGELIVGSNGTQAHPITVGAYGTGNRPIIKGSVPVTEWTQHQGNIWVATVSKKVGQVYVNGQRMIPARYPNTGWLRNSQGRHTNAKRRPYPAQWVLE